MVNKAKTACDVSSHAITDHFVNVNKMVELGSGSQRQVYDIMLTRYACYLIAQNGDPRKQEIAFAQTYFALQTRRAELIEQRLLEAERVSARKKLTDTENTISAEHVTNNQAVRQTLLDRGIRPESLLPDEDVKKVERRLASEEKKSLKKPDTLESDS
ncbi:hypothetical protein [Leptolyngbya sp. PCC 6406]|uniref:hypothetical protein n=1 Tax=Leptolyngbya sp. PCC 6406 TaxID=1173264 RepID=UPI0002AC1323|nr:hypothetical protein [Leptolyngbya sp. PCC 6406]